MRVAHVITRLIVGGAQENTIASVLGLHARGVQVNLISGPTSGPEGSLESAFADKPELLSISPHLVRPVHPVHDWMALRDLERDFRRQTPDIVHTHSGKAGVLGRIAASRAGVPVIIHTIHGPSFGSFQGPLANFAFRSAERYAAKFTTHFITVANAMSDQYLTAGIGRPEDYTRVLSGFDLAPFVEAKNDPELRRRLGIGTNDFVIGKIGRLFQLKGHDDLFDIATDLIRCRPQIKFLFVGGGEWLDKFRQKARALGLEDHFILTGLVPPDEVARYVGIMDALVHLSRREGLPRALPQALAAAKPVIAYDCDGAKEVCLDNKTGFLVPVGNYPLLTQAILRLADDVELRRRFGLNGQQFVTQNFSVEKMVEDIHRVYMTLVERRNPRS